MANGKYANLNNEDYWIARSEARVTQHWKNEKNVEKRLVKEYQTVASDIKNEIAEFYTRYAVDNGLTYADAIKAMSGSDLQEYRLAIESAKARIRLAYPDSPILADLDRLMASNNLTRLQGKVNQIEARLLEMGVSEQLTIEESLYGTYEDNYYQAIYEVQNGVGIGMSFNKLNEQAIKTAITMPWSGDMFSDIIWDNKRLLVKQLRQTITNGLIRGEGYQKMARNLNGVMDSGYKNALRIVRTETAHVVAESTGKAYDESGLVSQYIIIATLDNRTSSKCQKIDTKVFQLSERQLGVNYPPLHPNCRTTVAVWFDDDTIEEVTRIARGTDGKNYKVQGMNYEQWHAKYVN